MPILMDPYGLEVGCRRYWAIGLQHCGSAGHSDSSNACSNFLAHGTPMALLRPLTVKAWESNEFGLKWLDFGVTTWKMGTA